MIDKTEIEITADDATKQAFIEIGLGSILHSLHLPLSGQFLSLVQIFICSRTRKITDNLWTPAYMGSAVSCLKSLSPAGKRLTPMLAISMQGLLMSLGEAILGENYLGKIVGVSLSGVWSFFQPMILMWLFVGTIKTEVLQKIVSDVEEIFGRSITDLYFVIGLMIFVKIILSIFVMFWGRKISTDQFAQMTSQLTQLGQEKLKNRLQEKSKNKSEHRLALEDLRQPLVLFSVLISAVFFYYAQDDQAPLIWILFRPIAVAYLLFYLFRKLSNEKTIQWLRQKPDSKITQILVLTLQKISRF